jgi:hypothetical protein
MRMRALLRNAQDGPALVRPGRHGPRSGVIRTLCSSRGRHGPRSGAVRDAWDSPAFAKEWSEGGAALTNPDRRAQLYLLGSLVGERCASHLREGAAHARVLDLGVGSGASSRFQPTSRTCEAARKHTAARHCPSESPPCHTPLQASRRAGCSRTCRRARRFAAWTPQRRCSLCCTRLRTDS